jgi:hypothetical protein
MKNWLFILFPIAFHFCFEAKKVPFDLSRPSTSFIGFNIFRSISTPPTLSFTNTTYLFSTNTAISAITPKITGGSPTSCTSTPELPVDLLCSD